METSARPVCSFSGCGKVFFNRYNLRRHVRSYHMGVKYSCSVCGKPLSSLQSLREHHAIHTGAKLYRCAAEGCGLEFRQASQLSLHRREHVCSGPAQPVTGQKTKLEQELEKFRQGLCDVPFTTMPELGSRYSVGELKE